MKLPQLRPPSTSKIGPVSVNRTVAQTTKPAETSGHGEHRSQIVTYFTKIPVIGQPPEILYNGDRMWARVILTLETAGPVAVGQQSQIVPVLSGKGQLLETDVPTAFTIAKGNRIYIAATGVNRVKMVIEPYPWLEAITGLIGALVSSIGSGIASRMSGAPATPAASPSKL